MDDRTDFGAYSHAALIQMLHAGDADAVTAACEVWAAIGRSLQDRAGDLEDQLHVLDGMWQGDAANTYQAMLRDLVDGIWQTASTALTLRDLTHQASDALQKAWRATPSIVDVPALSPAVIATATNPLAPQPGANTAAVAAQVQRQLEAASLVRQHLDAVAAANTAHAQAGAVMTWLADWNVIMQEAVPQAPSATIAGVAADGTVVPGTGGRVNPAVAGGSTDAPLFSQVFRAGIAAAGAALGDRFGGIKLPAPGGAGALPAAAALTATIDGVGVPKIRRTGAGGLGELAEFDHLAGVPRLAAPGNVLGSAVGAATLSGQSGTTAGNGTGNGRRIPPRLVKTEDVWGEPAIIAPSMISDELSSPVNQW